MTGGYQTTAEVLNTVAEFQEVSEYMNDEEFTKVLELIVKIMSQPDIPPEKAKLLVVQCEGYAAKFAMLASFHAHIDKRDRAKKNMYYTGRDSMQRMADALKYILR